MWVHTRERECVCVGACRGQDVKCDHEKRKDWKDRRSKDTHNIERRTLHKKPKPWRGVESGESASLKNNVDPMIWSDGADGPPTIEKTYGSLTLADTHVRLATDSFATTGTVYISVDIRMSEGGAGTRRIRSESKYRWISLKLVTCDGSSLGFTVNVLLYVIPCHVVTLTPTVKPVPVKPLGSRTNWLPLTTPKRDVPWMIVYE